MSIELATKFEMAIDLKIAASLGLDILPRVLAIEDEVREASRRAECELAHSFWPQKKR